MLEAQLRLHWCDSGLYRRSPSPSMRPAGPSASSSSKLARPSHTLLTSDVPSYSAQVDDPVSGCSSRLTCVLQAPRLKSKSCCPSRAALAFVFAPSATPGPGAANAEAPIVIAVDATIDHKRRRAMLTVSISSSWR